MEAFALIVILVILVFLALKTNNEKINQTPPEEPVEKC